MMKGIMLNEEGDLAIRIVRKQRQIAGGLVIEECDEQLAERILKASRGEFKEVPLIGGEVYRLMHGTVDSSQGNRLKEMLNEMLLEVEEVTINETNVEVKIASK